MFGRNRVAAEEMRARSMFYRARNKLYEIMDIVQEEWERAIVADSG